MFCLSSAGLLKLRPMSLLMLEMFTPPRAVSCGVLGSFKKLNTELPPIVCACAEAQKSNSGNSGFNISVSLVTAFFATKTQRQKGAQRVLFVLLRAFGS